ncbi:hypothetical protein Tco_1334644 [Tanacetum coccineum]
MPKSNNDKKDNKSLKRTAQISVRACCFVNPPPPQPSFDSIERLANQPPPVPDVMEPPFPPLPPQLPPHSQPMSLNNAFPPLSHEMFCENYQRAQGSLFGIRFAAMAGIPSEILHAQVDALCVIAVI